MLNKLNKLFIAFLVMAAVVCGAAYEVRAENDYGVTDITENMPKALQDLKLDFDIVVYDADTKRAITTATKALEVGVEIKNQSALDLKHVQISFAEVRLANTRGLVVETVESRNGLIGSLKPFGSDFILVNIAPHKLLRVLNNDVYKITATIKVVILHKAGNITDPRNIIFTTEIEKVIKKFDIK